VTRGAGRRLLGVAALPLVAAVVAAGGVVASSAAWTDVEWDRAGLAALDCDATGIGSSTASGRLLGGRLLDIDLDELVALEGLRVSSDGLVATPDPSSADPVAGSGGTAWEDPIEVSALGAINADLGGLLVLPLDSEVGVVNQYARASGDATSAGAAGVVSDEGAIDLETETDPEDERPDLGSLALGGVLEEALGAPVSDEVVGLADLGLSLGAVASAVSLDGCAAAWGGDVYEELVREYAIAGLGLGLESPLVGQLGGTVVSTTSALQPIASGVSTSSTGLLTSLVGALTGPGGALTGVLGGLGLGTPTLDVAQVSLDLTAVNALLDETIGDDDGIVLIDPVAGTAAVDLAALFGKVYEDVPGSSRLNGLLPNTELLVDEAVVGALTTALASAVQDWVDDVVDAVAEAIKVRLRLTIPLTIGVTVAKLSIATGAAQPAGQAAPVSLASLMDGTAPLTTDVEVLPALGGLLCVVSAALCDVVNGLVGAITGPVLTNTITAIGGVVGALFSTTLTGLETTLNGLVAPVAGVVANSLGFLFGEDDGVLSVVVNAQNDPDPAAGGAPEPDDWAALPDGRYDVSALRIAVLGATAPLEVALDLARSSAGANVVTG